MKELKDTIDLMTSADYKDRFRAEYWQTLLRAHKLQTLLQQHKDGALGFTPDCPIELLHIQLRYMGDYLNVLRERAAIEGVKLEWHWPKQEEVKEEAPAPEGKTYLAVFSFTNREGDQGISNVDIGVKGNPSCVDNIREVEQGLKDAFGYVKVILLNLIPLEG